MLCFQSPYPVQQLFDTADRERWNYELAVPSGGLPDHFRQLLARIIGLVITIAVRGLYEHDIC
jgi:hypothetical protein